MSEMVERVARAMYDAIELKRPWDHPETQRVWGGCIRKQARAAIVAMRAPTEGMADHGREAEFLPGEFAFDEIGAPSNGDKEAWAKLGIHHHPGYETSTWQNAVCAGVWRSMIDEALR